MYKYLVAIPFAFLSMPALAQAPAPATTPTPQTTTPTPQATTPTPQATTPTPQTPANDDDKKADPEGDASKEIDRIRQYIDAGKVDPMLANQALAVLNDIILTTREDQDAVYEYVRTVNRNIDGVTCSAADTDCDTFKNRVRGINANLLKASYGDELAQNANLSNQIENRLPNLIEDSLLLTKDTSKPRRDDFLQELELLSRRYLDSKRFRAGFGIANSYLPSVTYRGNEPVDLSPFSVASQGGSDQLVFVHDFSDRSYATLLLTARMPYVQLDATLPNFDVAQTTFTTVNFRDVDETDMDVIARSTITSTLNVEYETAAKVSLNDVINRFRTNAKRRKEGPDASVDAFRRGDFGVSIGVTGFSIENVISTDARFGTIGSSRFNDLPAGSTFETRNERSWNTVFYGAYYSFLVSDEWHVGIDVRWFQDDTSDDARVEIGDATLSLSIAWYPTIPFRK